MEFETTGTVFVQFTFNNILPWCRQFRQQLRRQRSMKQFWLPNHFLFCLCSCWMTEDISKIQKNLTSKTKEIVISSLRCWTINVSSDKLGDKRAIKQEKLSKRVFVLSVTDSTVFLVIVSVSGNKAVILLKKKKQKSYSINFGIFALKNVFQHLCHKRWGNWSI